MAKLNIADIRLNLPNFDKDFSINIFREIQDRIKRRSANIIDRIRSRVRDTVRFKIENSQEYLAVTNGILRGELGIPDVGSIMRITDIWVNNIEVTFTQTANSFGMFKIGIIQSDYSDVLSSPDASFDYVSGYNNPYGVLRSGTIEWLKWLLLEGTNVLVTSYDFVPSGKGRTGMGTMVYSKAGSWTVPPEYAGIASDNFVLRALYDIDETFNVVIRQEITRGLE
jgi:hypothetical protein